MLLLLSFPLLPLCFLRIIIVKNCKIIFKNPKVFQKNADIKSTVKKKGQYMLKKIETPTCNTFSGVEYILRGAKKRRASAIANARRMNAEVGVQSKLVAVK